MGLLEGRAVNDMACSMLHWMADSVLKHTTSGQPEIMPLEVHHVLYCMVRHRLDCILKLTRKIDVNP